MHKSHSRFRQLEVEGFRGTLIATSEPDYVEQAISLAAGSACGNYLIACRLHIIDLSAQAL